MARCYHCGKVLDDAWVKRQGAALMGKTSGERKARSPELARKAGLARARKAKRLAQQAKVEEPKPPRKRRRKKV